MKQLYKNSLLYISATLAIKGAAFLLVPFYSYLVSPSEYGYVYIVYSIVEFVSFFIICSLNSSITRFYWECKSKDEVIKMYSTITAIVIVLTILIVTPILVLSDFFSSWLRLPKHYFQIAIFSSMLHCYYWLMAALLYQKQEAKKMSIATMTLGIAQIVVQLIMVLIMKDKALALVLSQLITGILMFFLFSIYSLPYLRLKFDKNRAWLYFKYGVCLMPSDLSFWLLSFSDRIMMNKMQGSGPTGIYGMGQTLGGIPKLIYTSINSAYVPFVYECYKGKDNGDKKKEEELKKHTTLIFAIVTLMVTLIIVFSNNFISLLNERYSQAFIVMSAMLLAVLIECYRKIFMNPLYYNVNYAKEISAIWTFSAIVNISLNFYLIPKYSIYGACFSMLFSFILSFIIIVVVAHKAYPVDYDIKKMTLIFVISIIASSMVLVGSSWILIPIKVLGTILYLGLLMRIVHIKPKDICLMIKNIKH